MRHKIPESPMQTAPQDATEVLLKVGQKGWPDHFWMVGHWASDLSGEEQPPFQGWFYNNGSAFTPVTPLAWAPLDWASRAGAEAMRERAAKLADKWQWYDMLTGAIEVGLPRMAAAIRALPIEE